MLRLWWRRLVENFVQLWRFVSFWQLLFGLFININYVEMKVTRLRLRVAFVAVVARPFEWTMKIDDCRQIANLSVVRVEVVDAAPVLKVLIVGRLAYFLLRAIATLTLLLNIRWNCFATDAGTCSIAIAIASVTRMGFSWLLLCYRLALVSNLVSIFS